MAVGLPSLCSMSHQSAMGSSLTGAAAGRVSRSIIALGSGEILSRAIAFVGTTYLARVLGPAAFGVLGFATAVCGYFALAVSAGVTDVGVRAVAARPAAAASLAVSVAGVRLVLALAALAVLAIVASVAPIPPTSKAVVLLTGLSFISLGLDSGWAYKGLERARPVGISVVMGQALFVGLILLGEGTAALWLLAPLALQARVRPDWRAGWMLVRASGPLAVTRVLRTIIFSFDVVLLGFLADSRSVGLYTAAYRVCYLVLAAAVTVHVAFLPGLTRSAVESRAALSALTTRSLGAALSLGVPAVVGGGVLAAPILVGLFGPAYAQGTWALRLLLLSIGCIFVSRAAYNVLLVLGRLRAGVAIVAVATVLNIAANVVLIPRYGLNGAAAATAAAEAVILVGTAVAIRRLGVHPWRWRLTRPLLAASLMATILVAWGPDSSLGIQVAVGAAIYGAGLAALGGVPPELAMTVGAWPARLIRTARRRLGGGT